MEHLLNQCPFSISLWNNIANICKRTDRYPDSVTDTIKNWHKHPFQNSILNRIWHLILRFLLWGIWKERNHRIFEGKSIQLPPSGSNANSASGKQPHYPTRKTQIFNPTHSNKKFSASGILRLPRLPLVTPIPPLLPLGPLLPLDFSNSTLTMPLKVIMAQLVLVEEEWIRTPHF